MLISFRDHKLINNILFDIYFRENNRYGGSQLIGFAEEVFFADSLFVISLLDDLDIEEVAGLDQAYLSGICSILTALFHHLGDMFEQVNMVPILDEHKKAFRQNKQEYIKKVEQLISGNYSGLSNKTMLLMAQREKAIKEYYSKIASSHQLTNSSESIIASIIHMFCNRLTGIPELERRYYSLIRESLSNIIEKNKRITTGIF